MVAVLRSIFVKSSNWISSFIGLAFGLVFLLDSFVFSNFWIWNSMVSSSIFEKRREASLIWCPELMKTSVVSVSYQVLCFSLNIFNSFSEENGKNGSQIWAKPTAIWAATNNEFAAFSGLSLMVFQGSSICKYWFPKRAKSIIAVNAFLNSYFSKYPLISKAVRETLSNSTAFSSPLGTIPS